MEEEGLHEEEEEEEVRVCVRCLSMRACVWVSRKIMMGNLKKKKKLTPHPKYE